MNTKYFIILLLFLSFLFAGCDSGVAKTDESMEEGIAWKKAEKEDTEYYYLKYGDEFPTGKHIKDVERLFDEINPGEISADQFANQRFTGIIEQVGDKKVFSLKFMAFETEGDDLHFTSMVNMGPIGRNLSGTINLADNSIMFVEDESETSKLMISDGRIYNRNGNIVIETTDLEEYWRLD